MMCMFFLILVTAISIMILNLNKILSMIKMINIEKKIPFECGFNPISNFSMPFSMPFFTVTLLFLIFDIEITMLIPMIVYLKFWSCISGIIVITMFIISMMVTLIAEWFMGYLLWMF
uniref:NADH-ubiquinone oxidoreductase chain 3 n=1 Tax=Lepidotrigona terminata TaxID=398115 RepID=A0A6B9MYU2_9HYME|nr:NADH dehydrogenase subunit 3 [Lepidotrigona terminata]